MIKILFAFIFFSLPIKTSSISPNYIEVDKVTLEHNQYSYTDFSWGGKKLVTVERDNLVLFDKFDYPGGGFEYIVLHNLTLNDTKASWDNVFVNNDNEYYYFRIPEFSYDYELGYELSYGEVIERSKYIKVKNDFFKEVFTEGRDNTLNKKNEELFNLDLRRRLF